ncbi:MAG: ABC transporter ATP-binding protein [Acidobacteria bacterium]|nr:ABC transporter ATP-binding protein [Acidobacteriota bacterium]
MLSLEDVSASYGRVRALFGVSLEVAEGEAVALLGANGAGKSTTLRAISGVIRPEGRVVFDGKRIDRLAPDSIARLGVAHVPEGRGLFPSLSVIENLKTGTFVRAATERPAGIERVLDLFPVLRERPGQLAGTLSGGEQQMLAIARGLVSEPRLLLVDELSLGLAPTIVGKLFALIPSITESGTAVLLVEQFVAQALGVARRAYVLESGRVAWTGTTEALAGRREFVEASYLGRADGGRRRNAGAPEFTERVQVQVPVGELRALQRRAAADGRSIEDLLAERVIERGRP